MKGRAAPPVWRASRYNFRFMHDARVALYNALTGSTWVLEGDDAAALAERLMQPGGSWRAGDWPPEVFSRLLEGGFLVAPDADEHGEVQRRFHAARREAPVVVTVTTTLDCNLACYYCFEERSEQRLDSSDAAAIVRWVEARLASSGKRSLHVDWYGGEPLLNPQLIETLSAALQALCRDRGVAYAASIVSNGTQWPDDPAGFVARHALTEVQISLDGMQAAHDRRRRWRRGQRPQTGASSFERAVALIDALLEVVRIDLRVNLDPHNTADALSLMEMARRRGWFDRRFPLVVSPARLARYSERSSFMRSNEIDAARFDRLTAQMRQACGDSVRFEDPYLAKGRVQPRLSVCAALGNDSLVFGADRALYRCGLQVSEPARAVGRLTAAADRRVIPIVPPGRATGGAAKPADDAAWWAGYDPTDEARCGGCSFLPLCWGGCPKHHLERDSQALQEQCGYWRRNLARYVLAPWFESASRATGALPELGEADQFRAAGAMSPRR